MIFPRSTFSWSTTCLCTLALSLDTGSDLVQTALGAESLQDKAWYHHPPSSCGPSQFSQLQGDAL